MSVLLASPALSDSGTVESSNEVSTLPATNLQLMQPTDIWRTNNLTGISIDINPTGNWNLVALLYSNVTSDATWDIWGADAQADFDSSPRATNNETGTLYMRDSGLSTDWPFFHSFVYWSTVQTDNWIRINITDAANPDGYIQAGRIYVANALTTDYDASFGYSTGWTDPSLTRQTIGGKTYSTRRTNGRARQVRLQMNTLKDAEINYYHELQMARGESEDVLVIKDPSDATNKQYWTVCGLMEQLSPAVHQNEDLTYKYQQRFVVTELR